MLFRSKFNHSSVGVDSRKNDAYLLRFNLYYTRKVTVLDHLDSHLQRMDKSKEKQKLETT